jgi:hypothetical protein
VAPRVLRRGLLDNGYDELPITSEHAVALDGVPPTQLIAQLRVEGMTLSIAAPLIARYPAPTRKL